MLQIVILFLTTGAAAGADNALVSVSISPDGSVDLNPSRPPPMFKELNEVPASFDIVPDGPIHPTPPRKRSPVIEAIVVDAERELCLDDPDFLFEVGRRTMECEWINREGETEITFDRRSHHCTSDVATHCPEACGVCPPACLDKKCEWINRKGETEITFARRSDHCTSDVATKCPRACGVCPPDCLDNSAFRFTVGSRQKKQCEWINRLGETKKTFERRRDHCAGDVETNCPKACGVCCLDDPTKLG